MNGVTIRAACPDEVPALAQLTSEYVGTSYKWADRLGAGTSASESLALMGYKSAQTSVGTTATLVATIASAPDTDGVLVQSSAAAYLGGSGVTTSTGFPIAANTPLLVPTTGAEPLSLYAVVGSSTATVSVLFPG